MKKLFLTLMACFIAIAANADYYLIGGFNDWASSDAKAKFTAKGDGTYELDLTSYTLTSGFKINNGSWSDGNNNFGAQNGAKLTLGTTYTLWANGSSGDINFSDSNLAVPNAHIVFNPTAKTLLITGQTEVATTIYGIHGQIFGDSNWSTENMIEKDGVWVMEDKTIVAGEFGIKAMNSISGSQTAWYAAANANDASLEPGKTVTCATSNTINFSIAEGTYTFTFDPKTSKLSVTGTSTGETPEVNEFGSWWVNVMGTFTGGDNTDSAPSTQPTAEGIASFSGLLLGTNSIEIKTWNGSTDAYYSYGNTPIPVDEWITLADAQSVRSTIAGATPSSVYDIKFNVKTNEVYITCVAGGDADPEYPEAIYFIGNQGTGNWTVPGVAMSNDGDGQYTLENVVIAGKAGGDGYFALTTVNSEDWSSINANRYGPNEGKEKLEPGTGSIETSDIRKGEYSWQIPAGIYNLTFDITGPTLTVEFVEEYTFEVKVPDCFYLRGVNGDWDGKETVYALNKVSESANNSGEYTYEITLDMPEGSFKLSEDVTGWDGMDFGGKKDEVTLYGTNTVEAWIGSSEDFWMQEACHITLTFYYNPETSSASWLKGAKEAISIQVKSTETQEGKVESNNLTLFTTGSSVDVHIPGTQDVPVYYTVNGGKKEIKARAAAANEDPATYDTDANAWKITLPIGSGTLRVRDENENSATYSYTVTKTDTVGVAGIEAENGEAVYFNLQGQKVANPDKGIFVKVVNGKAVKVVK